MLKAMTCPDCQSELVKSKTGYLCLHCGYAGKTAKKSLSKANNLSSSSPDIKPELVQKKAGTALTPPDAPITAIAIAPPIEEPQPNLDPTQINKLKPLIFKSNRNKTMPPDANHESTEAMVERALANSSDNDETLSLRDLGQGKPLDPHHLPNHSGRHHHSFIPGRPKQPGRAAAITSTVVAIILLGLAAYILPARAAAQRLTTKLAGASNIHYTGSLVMTGSSFLSVLDSNLTFSGSYATKAANQLNYDGVFASRNYRGSFISSHGKLYSQMTGNDLPFIRFNQGIATYHITPGDWYSSKLDTSLYKYYCETRPDTKYPSPLVWYQAIRQIKLHPSPLIGYDQKVAGHSTTHLRGTISGKDLNTAWANINSTLPEGCEWNNQLEDLSGMEITFDTWTSASFDRIVLHFNDKDLGVTGNLTLNLDQYNQPANVMVPPSAKNLADIFSGRAAIQARDFTRRANIDAIKVALDKYAKANKSTPPSSLSKLAPKYIAAVPKDPKGIDYSYSVSKKTYTLNATLEDAGQLYTVTGP